MTDFILQTKQLAKSYMIGDRRIQILDHVSLVVQPGEFLVISGSSGSGKTTLLSLLSGLDTPSSGRIILAGEDITDLAEDGLAAIRNRLIGFVFQAFHLIPSLNALENVMFPAELRKDKQAREKAASLLKRVGLWERRENFPDQLSGGEKQRVAICRALINDPEILFADEPTGNLDSQNTMNVLSLLRGLSEDIDSTLIVVTHDVEVSNSFHKKITIEDGQIIS